MPHRPPKPSWGGYWGSWLLGRICKKYPRCAVWVCSGSVESTWECSATTQTAQRRSPKRSRRPQSRAVTECESLTLTFTKSVETSPCPVGAPHFEPGRHPLTIGGVKIAQDNPQAKIRSGSHTVSLRLVKTRFVCLHAMYTERYATGTRRVSSHEPEVCSAPWSALRPTFVLPLKLDAQT